MQQSKTKKTGRPVVKSENRMRSMRLEDAIWDEVAALAVEERRSVSSQLAQLLSEALAARKAKRGGK